MNKVWITLSCCLLLFFSLGAHAATLTGLDIQGPTSVDEESSTAYTAIASWDDASTSDVTADCTWSENSVYADVNQAGSLMAYSVSADQALILSASYSSGEVTQSDTQPVSIENSNPANETSSYTGWWWEGDTKTGTGISIEQQGAGLYLAWYVYDDAGLPVWYSALMAGESDTFAGDLYRYTGWPLENNAPQAGYAGTVIGTVSVAFDSFGQGTLTYNDGARAEYAKTINRFMGGDVDTRDIQGWWWNTDYEGMGVFMESRGGQLFAAWYHYRDDGSPRWWISIADFANTDSSYAGEMYEYSGGQTLTGDYAVPSFEPSQGAATIDFSGDTATLAWGGFSYTLERFVFNDQGDDDTYGDRTDYSAVTLTDGGTYSSNAAGVVAENMEYASQTSDVPGVKVSSGGSLDMTHCKVDKTGGTSDRENSGFYGFNAGVLASSSSQVSSYSGTGTAAEITMTDCTITTNSAGSNGAFAFGEDAVVNLDHVTIVTTGSDNSRGVDATYGGTVNISNSYISTQGGSCAVLATDRYDRYEAPKINASNCAGTSAGTGSPCLYCTGTFVVDNCSFTATGSEAAAIEGLNSITMTDTDISGATKWGVMIYQSMSGDSSIGTGSFTMTGGTVTNYSTGPMFFVCNTEAVITLTGATLVNTNSDVLLWATTAAAGSAVNQNVNSSWGNNGGTVHFTATDQTLVGEIDLEENSSSIDLSLINSTYSGAVNPANAGSASVTLDADSSWEVTGDSYLDSFTNNGGAVTGTGTIYVNGVPYSS